VRAVLALLLALAFIAGCGGDDETSGTTTGANGECESAEAPEAREPETGEALSKPLDDSKTYTLVFDTSCGQFTITLDPDVAPKTSASLVALAQDGYFDDTVFHRVVPGFVIQGGDPTQTGAGGPGYSTVDVPPADAEYTKGVVAMAKSQFEPPGTGGSQFFIVTAENAQLPPDYALVGRVVDGMDVVERIGRLGDRQTERPTERIVIRSTTVSG
jgi:peptidyl-prolyl cis-trans isomerase B (cyclophilin B)